MHLACSRGSGGRRGVKNKKVKRDTSVSQTLVRDQCSPFLHVLVQNFHGSEEDCMLGNCGGPKVFETFDFKLHTYLVDLHNVWELI